jgi:hypothetical protein
MGGSSIFIHCLGRIYFAEMKFAESNQPLEDRYVMNFSWYIDITPNKMFSLYDYPIPGNNGLPLCEQHGRQLELKEVVLYDDVATEKSPPDHCWVCAD